jgi:hypothetical protein
MKYVDRLAVCAVKASDPAINWKQRERWRDAAKVYEHLLNCPHAHSLVEFRGGKKYCRFFDKNGKFNPHTNKEE